MMNADEMKSVTADSTPGSSPVIIVVEQDEGFNRLILEALQGQGLRAECIFTGGDAVKRASEDQDIILLLSVSLPDMTGKKVIESLQKNNISVPFIVITGQDDEQAVVEMMKLGARDYIVRETVLINVIPHIIKEVIGELSREVKLNDAEVALLKSEERYRNITEAITDYIYTVRVEDGKPVETAHSEACIAVTGYTREEFAADPYLWIRMVLEEDHDLVRSRLDKMQKGNIPRPVEYRMIRRDGALRWVESTLVPAYNAAGALISYDGIIRDITDRKETEEEIKALSSRNEAILAAVPDIIMEVDINKVYTWANKAGIKFFGDDVIGKAASDYFEGAQKTYDKVEPLFHGEENVIYVESRQRRRDGEKRLLAWWCRVLKDEQGTVTGALSTARDITDQKQSEDALRLSEEKFSKAFRSSPTFITISTLSEGRFIDVNDAFLDASGYTRDEVIGRTATALNMWADPDEREQMINLFINRSIVINKEVKHRIKSGDVLNLLWSAEQILIEGEPCIIAVALDITERKKLERQLMQAQKMEAIGQLAGGIAHDFNNILSAIINYTYLLNMRIKENSQACDITEEIITLSKKAAQITQGLLAFSRKHFINPVPLRINDIVHNMERLLTQFIGEEIRLKVRLADNAPTIMADSTQMEQVIVNLATNARDAMPEGGDLLIETDLAEIDAAFIRENGFGAPGMYALLTVTDTGVGMSEDEKQKIFDPFFTTKEVGKGTGLGLAISYGIIKQHNGFILVNSEQGNGACFKIYLKSVPAVTETKRDDPVPVLPGNRETLLIAEDEPSVRESIGNILKEQGYGVIEAENGEDAVKKFMANKDRIQLLIFDVIMPLKNGLDAYNEIKKISPGIKAIFVSGYSGDVIARKNIKGGSLNYIMKPILPDKLLKAIRDMLDAE